ncbi:dachshund homolog 1-like isoform X2 [Ptychodera flava]|uniref:dachshund homolog 1-like isoform X2 n=1 Tax=Ptychodera flava TaxID=63121 RepID=UPI00396A3599
MALTGVSTSLNPPTQVLFKLDKPAYSTPPPVSNDPANNECKMVEYRGAKVASFSIEGREMICLPQAFDLFLKHLVGGLHTVYTKLKRLDITPVVCNVEQVRILRGLGAIQPGVNRCKLVTRDEFDVLYNDCTTASRPGRPPKRTLPPPGLSPSGHFMLKKHKLENGDVTNGLDFSGFTPLGLRDAKTATIANGYISPYLLTTHPSMIPTSLAMATSHHHSSQLCRQEQPLSLSINTSSKSDGGSGRSDRSPSSSDISSPHSGIDKTRENSISPKKEKKDEMDKKTGSKDTSPDTCRHPVDLHNSRQREKSSRNISGSSYSQASLYSVQESTSSSTSSIETLLTNIQGLLKVAADNAKQQEKQINLEKAELKMELLREKELRESLEKQLIAEQKTRAIIQKRLKKEKKAKKRLQEQLENEQKLRAQSEGLLKQNSSDTARVYSDTKVATKFGYANESMSPEMRMDRNTRTESERKILDMRGSYHSFTDNFMSKNGHMEYPGYRMESKEGRQTSEEENDNCNEDNEDDMADIEDED